MTLLMHCGGSVVDREELDLVPTPPATKTHHPIPHGFVAGQVEENILAGGLEVVSQEHGLSKDGSNYFGLWQVRQAGVLDSDWGMAIGCRNSHIKMFRVGMTLGVHVFVCDNLSFAGEVVVSRKHTRHVLRDVRQLIPGAMHQLIDKRRDVEHRFNHYRGVELIDSQAHDVVIRLLDQGAISTRQIPTVLEQWREPDHPEFGERNFWRMHNAVTESYKGLRPDAILQRSPRLESVLDQASQLPATLAS